MRRRRRRRLVVLGTVRPKRAAHVSSLILDLIFMII
jgi:hypothetical protein